MNGEEIKCPCSRTKCRNTNFRDVEAVKLHVLQSGFVPDYYVWIHHGEVNVPPVVQQPVNEYDYYNEGGGDLNSGQRMGSISLIDDTCRLLQELLPENNKMPNFFANIKKLVKGLGLPVEVIECCFHNYMIYWGADEDLTHCKVCTFPRWKPVTKSNSAKRRANVPYKKMFYFPLTLRLQRLYASKATAKHMTWHADHEMEDEKMCHPSDSPAWKRFSELHTDFADETRNIRLGLFIVTPYNLPPGMCMKDEFMFLTILVPGPGNPKDQMDISLQPLIAELNQLWESGIRTTSGRLACPHCMENTEAFTLPDSGKQSWFDCHRKFLPTGHHFRRNVTDFRKGKQVKHKFGGVRTGDEVLAEVDGLGFKRAYETDAKATNADLSKGRCWNRKSIFWDLPYWKTNVIRHNLDVMHIEKNVFDNVFNTVLNVPGKTKDTAKSRAELNKICDRPGLAQDQETGRYPKALYALDRDLKKILLEWIQKLKFPDGYVSNLSRCVDLNSLKMMGMKSRDCHVFMQRLLPIALRELLPPEVWEPLTELSIFFRELTATSLKKADLERLYLDIPKILCKYLRKLKNKVSNKGRVEGSISSGYLLEETAKFASFYFKDGDPMLPCRMQRNEVCEMDVDDDVDRLSIFKPKGRPIGASRNRYLDDAEYNAARSYILLNCTEIEPFREVFEGELYEINPEMTQTEVVVKLESEFSFWFEQYVKDQTVCTNPYILSLAEGPLRSVKTFKGYCVNGFKFNTEEYGEDRVTMNSGVCVKGSLYGPAESDFYGVLTDIIELEYPALPIKRTVLFKCNWFDPTKKVGMLAHPRYNIVDVNHRKRYNKYEPFILAEQSDQVHYLPYPSKRRDKKDWWAVCKIKARSEIDMPETTVPAFQDDSADHLLDVITNEEPTNLVDPNGEADEAALHNPPLVETEDDYPPSSSDDEDIGAADNIEIA
ncbi:uncharacterized protein LOC130014845 [Mercurialis annua]|uniref:uncharacterized protein LOC130014845 n=1 Tax=Mercurialis annua TaxID=3986 RepID=UPI0024ACDB99|nr:uncharacterized protein LOC130014845 [Mercurialis annua]